MSPEGLFHAAAGAVGIITGIIAVATLKGGPTHRAAGKVFVAAMVAAALSAIVLAFRSGTPGFIGAGVLIVYFMLTAWMAVKRRENEAGWFEIIAFLFAAAGAAAMYYAWQLALRAEDALLGGLPILIFAIVATLCALGDLSVVLRRGLAGRQRILRHLWRMHLGFFAAVGSFFPGQLQMFPEYIQNIRPLIVLFIPPFSIAALMLFWLGFVIFSKQFAARPAGAKA
ncbi:MAG TPA: hypothetical protein VEA80_09100 [Vitreimonas sp.]|uniref:hypothetical protein n=1 Tax=Vitreimonas sp. TaxID=3069702 RepID=UPI002D5BF355|nr:hypothetical protein [Vitreimonas sp.]HYD87618.1 hypothetical protein [Vitreimonas sp.]